MWNLKRLTYSLMIGLAIFLFYHLWFTGQAFTDKPLIKKLTAEYYSKESFLNPKSWALQKLPLVRHAPQQSIPYLKDTLSLHSQVGKVLNSKDEINLLTSKVSKEGTTKYPAFKYGVEKKDYKESVSQTSLITDPKQPIKFQNISIWTGKIITKVASRWRARPDLCQVQQGFILSRLSGPVDTPIYVYDRDTDEYISGSIISNGMWEGDLVRKMYHLLQKERDAAFLDIGANIGVFSLTMAKLGRQVYSVDCLKSNVMRLCSSVRKGNLSDRVTVIYNALSHSHQNVTLGTYNRNVGGTYVKTLDSSAIGNVNSEIVTAILLDDMLDIVKAKKVMIKMDVETYEANVLKGAERFFSEIEVLVIMMEFKVHRGKESGKFIVDFLHKHGLEPDFSSNNVIKLEDTKTWPENVLWKRKHL